MHLAEFNIGILKYEWDDPRVADFVNGLDRVFLLAARAEGYVWHLSEIDMEQAQLDPSGALAGNPRTASTLSVWRDADSLRHFVWNTVHARFVARRSEWYDPDDQLWSGHRLVMWWVPEGHRPTIDEAVDRLEHLARHGESDYAFGWDHIGGAR